MTMTLKCLFVVKANQTWGQDDGPSGKPISILFQFLRTFPSFVAEIRVHLFKNCLIHVDACKGPHLSEFRVPAPTHGSFWFRFPRPVHHSVVPLGSLRIC